MAIQTVSLDPNAVAYTDDEIVAKINAASEDITRASSVSAAARPIEVGEVTATEMSATAAKDNLDSMGDTARGYIKTDPASGQFKVIAVERKADGKVEFKYDDVAV